MCAWLVGPMHESGVVDFARLLLFRMGRVCTYQEEGSLMSSGADRLYRRKPPNPSYPHCEFIALIPL